MKSTLKKFLSITLVVSMLMSMCTFAFAAGEENQVVSDGKTVTTEDGMVKHSKMIEQKGENEFEITLKVQTKEDVTKQTVSQDAAVVLVLDVSNSMVNGGRNDIVNARNAANGFVEKFIANAGDGQRKVAVVEFGSNAKTVLGWTDAKSDAPNVVNTDVTTAIGNVSNKFSYDVMCEQTGAHTHRENITRTANDLEYKDRLYNSGWYCKYCESYVSWNGQNNKPQYINHSCKGNVSYTGTHVLSTETDGGGTNMEGALRLANNLLGLSAVSDIKNTYVVLMTDGVPSYNVADADETTSTTFMKGTKGGGNEAKHADYHDIYCTENQSNHVNHGDNIPQQIKNKGAKIYTVSYKTDNVTDKVNTMNIDAWLAAFATQNVSAGDNIFSGLGNIAQIIVNQAQAWTLTDPMGEYINFVSGDSVAADNSSDAVRKFNTDTKTLTWDLKNDATRTGPKDGWYTYTMSYNIKLDNTAAGFEGSKAYATNGTTALTYMLTDENGQLQPDLKDTELVVPTVKGYLASLNFTKKAYGNPLSGASFHLVAADDESIVPNGNSGADGSVSVTNIPSGHTYTLKEVGAPSGWAVSTEEWTVTVAYGVVTVKDANGKELNTAALEFLNKKLPGTTSKEITKTWVAADGTSYPSIEVTLTRKGDATFSKTYTMTSANAVAGNSNQWKLTINNLDRYDPETGSEYVYEVAETKIGGESNPEEWSYNSTVNGMSIKNIDNGKTSVSVKKVWADDKTSHDAVTVQLLGRVNPETNTNQVVDQITLNDSNEWKHTFADLAKCDADGVIPYTVAEVTGTDTHLPGYSAPEVTGSIQDGFVITNRINQAYTKLTVTKVWQDNSDAYSTRPGSVSVKLKADGSVVETLSVTGTDDTWTAETTKEYPVYKVDQDGKVTGQKITYTIEEDTVALASTADDANDEYVASYDKNDPLKVTNTLTGTTSVSGTKTWVMPEGETITKPEVTIVLSNGDTTKLTADDTYAFTNLPKYNDSGVKIPYSIQEVVAGNEETNNHYQKNINGFDVTNTYTENVTISGTKTWKDNNNEYKTRPDSITVKLYDADDMDRAINTVTVGANENWNYSFTTDAAGNALPKYKTVTVEVEGVPAIDEETGKPRMDDEGNIIYEKEPTTEQKYEMIHYVVRESAVSNYEPAYGENYNITNTLTGKTANIVATKSWDDNNDAGKIRPASVTIILYRNSSEIARKTAAAPNWTVDFGKQDQYDENGAKYTYTVDEIAVDGYTKSVNNDTYTITNTIIANAVTTVSGTKTWVDGNSENRPESITINLLRDDVKIDSQLVTKGEDGSWKYSFADLPVYYRDAKTGKIVEYKYTVSEDAVTGYKTTTTGLNFTNTLEEIVTDPHTSFSFTKTWIAPSGYELPLEDAVFTIKQNNIAYKTITGKDMTQSESSSSVYTYELTKLPKYDATGALYQYSVEETVVPADFDQEQVSGSTAIANTIKPGSVEISGTKEWKDVNEHDEHPTITIKLYQDTTLVAVAELKNGETTFKFDKYTEGENTGKVLPKYAADGHEFTYTVEEDAVAEYNSAIVKNQDGTFTVTNTEKTYKTVTVLYKDIRNGNEISTKYEETKETGSEYDVTDKDAITIRGYKYDHTEDKDALSGTLDEDTVIIVWYTKNRTNPDPKPETPEEPENPVTPPEDIDEPDVPLAGDPEIEDLGDSDVPLAGLPGDELEDLEEEEVPLAAVPKTSDMALFWLASSALSGIGLGALNLKKREDEDEQ